MPTQKELGQSLKKVRFQYGHQNRTKFAARLGVSDATIKDRELGRTAISLSDLIDYANTLGVPPVAFLADMLSHCDDNHWQGIATQLNCTVSMARRRLAEAQKRHGLTHGQAWNLYLQEQITL